MMAVRVLRLSVKCPSCGAPPKIRSLPEMADLVERKPPQTVLLTYECHLRLCRTRYEIRVKHFQDAG